MAYDGASAARFEQDLQAVADGRSDTLDLSRDDRYDMLHELPAAIRQLRRLGTLRLAGCGLTELPEWLAEITIARIDARGCPLRTVPPIPWVDWALDARDLARLHSKIRPERVYGTAVGPFDSPDDIAFLVRLVQSGRLVLSELTIETARWAGLSPAALDDRADSLIAGSPRLRNLSIVDYPLERIPESIRGLRHLTGLRLSGLFLTDVPDWLFESPVLSSLDLSRNMLGELPATLHRAGRLTDLDLSFNPIQQIPDEMWELSGLTSLDMRGCPIQRIPADILRLGSLTELRVDHFSHADAAVPPPEVTARGLEAIRSYWSQRQTSGMDHLAEAKLLIVGEPGAGKTTLAKKILDPGYRLDPEEGSTQGIGVHSWRFRSAIRVDEQIRPGDFRVNIWDFGGQEIYHSTHQFFLTRRSVYVLVTDTRKEDTDFHYWLEVINLLSDGSPLIIVQNRKEGRAPELDLRTLRREYPNLVATFSVDLATDDGLPDAVHRIRRELETLQHIGTPLPKTWQDVRMALEEDPREYISENEFFRICESHGFVLQDDMRQLGGFLHDLGICLYFQDDDVLKKTIVLKPQWGTSAVYRILDDTRIQTRQGVFGSDDLHRIWHEPIYESVRDQLVRLMAKFSLCFPVPGAEGRYVAPQLLPLIRPEYRWDEPGTLPLRYEYEVMPKGIVRRLIVELHGLLEDGAVWFSGAVFAHQGGRAEVIEDYWRRRLHIRLSGRGSPALLARIDRALDRIHRAYPDLKAERRRPCSCESCRTADEPQMFSVRELQEFARAGDLIQCRASRRMVDAAALLNELWRSEEMAGRRRQDTPGEVFVSYRWGGDADALVDEMQGKLAARGVAIIRDRDELTYRGRIQQFMRRLGAGAAVILVLDDAYMRSMYCMFELTELAARDNFARYVFPIALPDLDIYDPVGRIKYVRYWEQKQDELERELRTVGPENLHGIREDLDLYHRIRSTIGRITDVLRDMNALTVVRHTGTDFADLYLALEERLRE